MILASLVANEVIKFYNSMNDFYSTSIINKGLFAYEDEKYLQIETERSRTNWSFYIFIASLFPSITVIIKSIHN